MFQMKEQDKTSEKEINKMEISSLLIKKFKVTIIKMIHNLGRRMDKHSENFNNEVENIKKKQTKAVAVEI